MKTKFYLQLLIVLLLGSLPLLGQDVHFSQFYHAPISLSPALTGVSKGTVRFTGIYRSQWNTANSPYKTILASAEQKFYSGAHPRWWFSAGLQLFNDRAGDGRLATTAAMVSGAYTKMMTRATFLTLGASAGFGQRQFDFSKYSFGNQWNGETIDPDRDPRENFPSTSNGYPSFGIGFNWRGQKASYSAKPRSKMDLGAGAYHLNTPGQGFKSGDKIDLPVRLSIYFLPTLQLSPKGDLVGHATFQKQDKYTEILGGAAYRHHISTRKAKEVALQFGAGVRLNSIGDAIIPAAELHYRDLLVGLSWDLNFSNFSEATKYNGGPELAVRYIIHKVQPLRAFKACPLI